MTIESLMDFSVDISDQDITLVNVAVWVGVCGLVLVLMWILWGRRTEGEKSTAGMEQDASSAASTPIHESSADSIGFVLCIAALFLTMSVAGWVVLH